MQTKLLNLGVALCLMLSFQVSATNSTKVYNLKHKEFIACNDKHRLYRCREVAKELYQLAQANFPDRDDIVAGAAYSYATALLDANDSEDWRKALNPIKDALKRYTSLHGEDSEKLIQLYVMYGHAVAKPYRRTNHAQHLQKAVELAELNYGEGSKEHVRLLLNAGNDLIFKSYNIKAVKRFYKKVDKLLPAITDELLKGEMLFHLGKFEMMSDKTKKSLDYFERALAIFESGEKQVERQLLLSTHGFLVRGYEKLDQQDKATPHSLAIGSLTPYTAVEDYMPVVRAKPKYPLGARYADKDGWVIVKFDVDEQGFTRNHKIIDSEGAGFHRATLDAVKKFRYAPRFIDGKPVVTKGVEIKQVFKMAK